jgi:hypothetical protein
VGKYAVITTNVSIVDIRHAKPEEAWLRSLTHLRQVMTQDYPFKDEAQTALFKDPVRTAL